MAQNKDLQDRIHSIKTIRQITQAMRMVAVAKLEKTKKKQTHTQCYLSVWEDMIKPFGEHAFQKELLCLCRGKGKRLLLLVTSSRGLCGAYNNTLFSQIESYHEAYKEEGQLTFLPIGKKGTQFLAKKNWSNDLIFEEQPHYASLEDRLKIVASHIEEAFISRVYDAVDIMWQPHAQMKKENVQVEQLLPLTFSFDSSEKSHINMIYEPDKGAIKHYLLQRYLLFLLQERVLEAQVAEQKARMLSMTQAADNANDLLKNLKHQFNRSRQSNITRQIIDIASGVEAQKQ